MQSIPVIAIVGKPNVGKSSLFNTLIKKRKAIISDIPGTTRDRISDYFEFEGYKALLVDTGGLEYENKKNESIRTNIEKNIQEQAKIAINEADIILFIIDNNEEFTKDDFLAADILRKSKKTILFIANKYDNPQKENFNIYELGFGEALKVSAIHKIGIEELRTSIISEIKKLKFPKYKQEKIFKNQINLCILGKPNAGKSSLVNALTGSEKIIVSDIPGTTRDSIDTEIIYKEEKFNLIDTAGLKRRGKIGKGIDKYSSIRALQAIERSDIAVLLIDGEEGVSSQDLHISQYILEAKKGLIIAINKLDLFKDDIYYQERLIRIIKRKFTFIPWAPIILISAKNKKNTYQILNLAEDIMKERKKEISTAEINGFFQKITQKHLPMSAKTIKPNFKFANQVDANPPTFVIFFKNLKNLHFAYPRYLENELRKEYGFNGTSIHLKLKEKV